MNEPASVTFTSATINGKPARQLPGNTFEAILDVTPGLNNVTVRAQDASGNVRTNTYQVEVSDAGTSFTYDATGNLLTKSEGGTTWTYEWNIRNQLQRVSRSEGGGPPAEVARFKYDTLGRRVEKVVGNVTYGYLYDGMDILEESVTSGGTTTIHRYTHGPGIDEPLSRENLTTGAVEYYHADGLGSIVKMTSSSGAIVQTRKYDAWGNLEVGAEQPGFAYTGREWDPEIGLYYYRARYYDPKAGRFISEDPIGFGAGVNFFAYVENSPVNLIDPFGLAPGDKKFGLPDEFWKWAHRHAMEAYDLAKKEAEELYNEWKRIGKPGPDNKGKYGPRGGGGANAVALTCIVNPELCAETQRQLECVIKNDPGPVPPGKEGNCRWISDGWRSWYLYCEA